MGQLTRNEVFTLAVQKYSDAVYRAAIHNSRCTADAEDVVQDVYEKLLHYNGTFESEEHLKAWLLRVAINRCRDLTRAAHQKDTGQRSLKQLYSTIQLCTNFEQKIFFLSESEICC